MEARDALHGGVAGGPAGMAFGIPGGQVHVEMSVEGSLNIPVTAGSPPTPGGASFGCPCMTRAAVCD